MAMYTQGNKRQKTGRDTASRSYEPNEFFTGISRLEHRPDAGADDSLCFRQYNSSERVHGRTMEEWIRPAVSMWHTFHYQGKDSHGDATFTRTWDQEGNTQQENHKRRIRATFELCTKLGMKYWSGFDRDLAPEGDNFEETNQYLDENVELLLELQQKSGVRALNFGCDLFSHPRYMNGAATNPDPNITAYAAAQLKKALEVAHKIGAENFVIWGAREGYQNPLIADMPREIRLYARFLKMVSDYKEKLGYRGQLLIRPGPTKDCRDGSGRLVEGRYDYDTMSALCLLKHHGLEKNFKLSVTPGRDHLFAAAFNCLGGINVTSHEKYSSAVTSEPFGPDITLLFKTLIEQSGMQPGGCSIELCVRRESTDLKDIFVLYAQVLDSLARGLRSAVRVTSDGLFSKHLQQRYSGYQSGIGQRLVNGEATIEECEEHVKRHAEPALVSTHLEHWAAIYRYYN